MRVGMVNGQTMNLARAKTREGGPRQGTLRGNFTMQSSAALNNTQEVISGSLIDIAGDGNSMDPNSTSRVQPYNQGEF